MYLDINKMTGSCPKTTTKDFMEFSVIERFTRTRRDSNSRKFFFSNPGKKQTRKITTSC